MGSVQTVDITNDVVLNGAQSALVRVDAGIRDVRISNPKMVALDVRDSPDLEHLDVSGCAPGFWVSIAGCDALRAITLPDAGDGASVHVDFGARPPQLHAAGLVQHVDFCWYADEPDPHTGRRLRSTSPLDYVSRRRALRGLYVGPANDDLPNAAALVVSGGRVESTLWLPPDTMAAYIERVEGVVTVARRGSGVADAESHPEVARSGNTRNVVLTDLPELRAVEGSGTDLRIVNCGSAELMVEGSWRWLYVNGGGFHSIDARYVDELGVAFCKTLKALAGSPYARVSVVAVEQLESLEGPTHVQFEQNGLSTILAHALNPNPRVSDLVFHWLAQRTGPTQMLEALQILHAAAAHEVDPVRLWTIRSTLHARNRAEGRLRNTCPEWSWQLPTDQGSLGWEADLQLWRIAERHALWVGWPEDCEPDPVQYRTTLSRAHEPEHLLAFARAAERALEEPDVADDWLTMLRDALQRGGRVGKPLPGERDQLPRKFDNDTEAAPTVHAELMDCITGVLNALVTLRAHPATPAAATAFCHWLAKRLPNKQGVDVLGSLHKMGATAADEVLSEIAASDEDATRRKHALAQLVAPVEHDFFADASTTEKGEPS